MHEGGYQQAADEQGVDEDREAEPEAELRQFPGAAATATTTRPS